MGLTSTAYDVDELPAEHLATGYARRGDAFIEEPFAGYGAFASMGGLFSSVRDLTTWVDGFARAFDMYANPASTYKGATLIGSGDVDIFQRFLDQWQTGQATDLQGGLEQTAKQIDDAVAQASVP